MSRRKDSELIFMYSYMPAFGCCLTEWEILTRGGSELLPANDLLPLKTARVAARMITRLKVILICLRYIGFLFGIKPSV